MIDSLKTNLIEDLLYETGVSQNPQIKFADFFP